MNKVILIGHLGGDPDVYYSQSGGATVRVGLATKERRKDRSGERQEHTEWHRLVFFGKLAEIAAEYLKKGQQISVTGKIRSSKYTDRDGIERKSTEIIVDDMEMLGRKDDRQGGASDRDEPRQHQRPATSGRTAQTGDSYRRAKEGQSAPPPPPQDDFDDDDIPF